MWHVPGRLARAKRSKSRYDVPLQLRLVVRRGSVQRGPAAAIRGYTMPRADNVSCETTVSTKFTLPAALLQALALTASHTSARGRVCCFPEV